jgi:4-amino-4-deoxy-L-arabinose transferase-like glycosyltransferase
VPGLLLLLAIATILFFSRLHAPLLEPQEPRYAEIAREMLAEGRFLVPVLHGQAYLDKPPLFYWLTMASYHILGVSDRAARVVPAVAGVLTVLLTFLWGRAVLGPRAAFWGALVLCLSARFVYLERLLTFDAVLCVWITAALGAAHTALHRDSCRFGWWLAAGLAGGLGVLTKGPVAVVLVVAPLLAWQFLDPRVPRLTWGAWAGFIAVISLVAAPWFSAVIWAEPEFARYFFWTHNVVRFVAPFDHTEPFWFHLPGLLLGMLPWSLLVPGLVWFYSQRSPGMAAQRPGGLGFLVLAFLSGLLFFSASGCKRAVYILPVLPPLSLLLGHYLTVLMPSRRGLLRPSRLAWTAGQLVLVLALTVVVLGGMKGLLHASLTWALAGTSLAGLVIWCLPRVGNWPACALTTFLVLVAAVQVLLPVYNRHFALRHQLRFDASTDHGRGLTVCCFPQGWDSVCFYLPNADMRVYSLDQRAQLFEDLSSRRETLLLVRSGKLLAELLRGLPASLEFVRQDENGAVTVGRIRRHLDLGYQSQGSYRPH